jgi:ankyrin repeat protein
MLHVRGGAAPIAIGLSTLLLAAAATAAQAAGTVADAARAGDLDQVRRLLAAGTKASDPQADGSTALLWAAYQSDVEMVTTLLAAGADPNAANHFGLTPLLQASRTGDAPLIQALLDGGADLKLAGPSGETPLMAAARSGNSDAVSLLLERGADPNAVESNQGQTALMWAVAEGHIEVVDLLLKAGVNPNQQARVSRITKRSINSDFPSGGFTALMWAARNGDEAIISRLLDAGADLNVKNGDGASAMMIAIVNDRFDLAAKLVELGADADDGSLYYAVEMHDATTDWFARDGSRLRADHPNELSALDLIKVLLDAGADPDKPFIGQMHSATMCCDTFANGTPLFRAAIAADVEALKLMIARGADVRWTPKKVEAGGRFGNLNADKTPLLVAISGGKGVSPSGGPGDIREGRPPPFREASNREPADAVRVLLEAGADPNAVGPNGVTPLHQAAEERNLDVIRLLAEAGAALDKPNGDGLTALDLAEGRRAKGAKKPPAPAVAEDSRNKAKPEEVARLLRDLMKAAGVPVVAHGVPAES